MTLLTKGMGAIRKAVKKGTKSVKQGFVNPKTNRKVLVNARKGRDIIKKYLSTLYGGSRKRERDPSDSSRTV